MVRRLAGSAREVSLFEYHPLSTTLAQLSTQFVAQLVSDNPYIYIQMHHGELRGSFRMLST